MKAGLSKSAIILYELSDAHRRELNSYLSDEAQLFFARLPSFVRAVVVVIAAEYDNRVSWHGGENI